MFRSPLDDFRPSSPLTPTFPPVRGSVQYKHVYTCVGRLFPTPNVLQTAILHDDDDGTPICRSAKLVAMIRQSLRCGFLFSVCVTPMGGSSSKQEATEDEVVSALRSASLADVLKSRSIREMCKKTSLDGLDNLSVVGFITTSTESVEDMVTLSSITTRDDVSLLRYAPTGHPYLFLAGLERGNWAMVAAMMDGISRHIASSSSSSSPPLLHFKNPKMEGIFHFLAKAPAVLPTSGGESGEGIFLSWLEIAVAGGALMSDKDEKGRSALFAAFADGSPHAMDMLAFALDRIDVLGTRVEGGHVLNATGDKESGTSLLHLLVDQNQVAALQAILQHPAASTCLVLDPATADGATPLLNAVGKGNLEIVTLLLEAAGGNPWQVGLGARALDGTSVMTRAYGLRESDEAERVEDMVRTACGFMPPAMAERMLLDEESGVGAWLARVGALPEEMVEAQCSDGSSGGGGTGLRIQIVSDVHTEFLDDGTDWGTLVEREAPILGLLGDIGLGYQEDKYHAFVLAMAEVFDMVLLLPGNHEYYAKKAHQVSEGDEIGQEPAEVIHGRIEALAGSADNIHFLDRSCVVVDDVRIVGATMWGYVTDPGEQDAVGSRMNDYRRIKVSDPESDSLTSIPVSDHGGDRALYPLTVGVTNAWHMEALAYIAEQAGVAEDEGQTLVVLSHHAPTVDGTGKVDFVGSNMTHAMGVDLVFGSNPDHRDVGLVIGQRLGSPSVWAYGHTHWFYDRVTPGSGTRIISHPKGYPHDHLPWQSNGFVFSVPSRRKRAERAVKAERANKAERSEDL